MLDGRAAVAADLAADAALVGPGPGIRELADVASQHCRDVLQVQAWKRGSCVRSVDPCSVFTLVSVEHLNETWTDALTNCSSR